MNVVSFLPPRPYVELLSTGRLASGEDFLLVVYHPSEADGGGHCGVWDGTDYELALEAARLWQADGLRLINTYRAGGTQ